MINSAVSRLAADDHVNVAVVGYVACSSRLGFSAAILKERDMRIEYFRNIQGNEKKFVCRQQICLILDSIDIWLGCNSRLARRASED